jgi:hypothetical protein
MKVTRAEHQQMIELQLAQVRKAQSELHYRKTLEDYLRLLTIKTKNYALNETNV